MTTLAAQDQQIIELGRQLEQARLQRAVRQPARTPFNAPSGAHRRYLDFIAEQRRAAQATGRSVVVPGFAAWLAEHAALSSASTN